MVVEWLEHAHEHGLTGKERGVSGVQLSSSAMTASSYISYKPKRIRADTSSGVILTAGLKKDRRPEKTTPQMGRTRTPFFLATTFPEGGRMSVDGKVRHGGWRTRRKEGRERENLANKVPFPPFHIVVQEGGG